MSNVNLVFLGEEYSIPSELKDFVGYLNEFDRIREEVMSLLTSQIRLQKFSGGADEDFAYFKNPLTKAGQTVIGKLAQEGIFDVTIDDVVYQNTGYIQLHNVCSETMQGMVNILLDAMSNWLRGYENAYSSATSNVTGSGVSIWTNSLSSALIYSAMEASTLKKQSDKANREYVAAMSALDSSINDTQKRQERDLLVNKYYPCAAEALNLFVSELMEFYITKLEEKGVFSYSLIKKYNLQRSTGILNNIDLVEDKVGILKQAFVCCPYNPDVYKAVLDNYLADVTTFETAKYFMQDQLLLESLEEFCNNNLNSYNAIAAPMKIIAIYKGQDEKVLLTSIYSGEIQSVLQKYNSIKSAVINKSDLVQLIKDNITSKASELCALQDITLAHSIDKIISREVIPNRQFDEFCELGLLSISDIAPSNSTSKTVEEVNKEYIQTLTIAITAYISELKPYVKKCSDAAAKIKEEYDITSAEYAKKKNMLNQKLASLRETRQSIGLFALGKKKKMDSEIFKLQEEIEMLKMNDPTYKLKQAYENELKEADRFI